MFAAVLVKQNSPLQLFDGIAMPPLRAGQVLVKLAYSGICHSQLMEIDGKRGEDRFIPHLLGHEGSGEVLEVGPSVTKIKKGDHVVLTWIRGEGCDEGGTQYQYEDMVLNAGAVTTFNDYAIVSENRCVAIPKSFPLKLAALLGCAIPTGTGMALNELPSVETHSVVAVIGLGGVGLSALLGCVVKNYRRIIAIDISSEKLSLARELGATDVVHAGEMEVREAVDRITDGQGVDVCIEAAGRVDTIELGFSLVRKSGGLCVFASHPEFSQKICIDPFDLISGKEIKGSWGGGVFPDRDIPRFIEYFDEGLLPLQKMVSEIYPLANINAALDSLRNGKAKRILLSVG